MSFANPISPKTILAMLQKVNTNVNESVLLFNRPTDHPLERNGKNKENKRKCRDINFSDSFRAYVDVYFVTETFEHVFNVHMYNNVICTISRTCGLNIKPSNMKYSLRWLVTYTCLLIYQKKPIQVYMHCQVDTCH